MPRFAIPYMPHVLLGLAPVLAYVAPLGLWISVVLLGLLETGAALRTGRAHAIRDALVAPSVLWLIPLLGVLSALWALDPRESLERGGRLALELAFATLAVRWVAARPAAERSGMSAALLLSAGAVGCVTAIEYRLGAPLSVHLYDNPEAARQGVPFSRGAAFHAVVLVPAALAVWTHGRRAMALAGVALGVAAVFAHSNETAMAAVVLAAVTGAALILVPRLRHLVAPALTAAILVMPLTVPAPGGTVYCTVGTASVSLAHRIHIWDFVRTRIEERPLLGWGLESERRIPGGKDTVVITGCGPDPVRLSEGERLPLHPHNAALQVWLDFGLLGTLAVAGALAVILHRTLRRTAGRNEAAAVGAMTAAGALVAFMSYGLWQTWFISALVLGAATTRLAVQDAKPEMSPRPAP